MGVSVIRFGLTASEDEFYFVTIRVCELDLMKPNIQNIFLLLNEQSSSVDIPGRGFSQDHVEYW